MEKAIKRKLGITAAAVVAAANLAFTQPAEATISTVNTGDLGIVPYYNVNDGFVTGVHITNTSDSTQVVKFRLRRATDSEEVLDFNIVLSPYDLWTGTIRLNGDQIAVRTFDNTCTMPAAEETFITSLLAGNANQREGYVEVIAMGQTIDEAQPIALAAKHANGTPANCSAVRTNFLAANVLSSTMTMSGGATSTYEDSENVIKTAFFLRNFGTGVEFGSNAKIIEDFSALAMMTNQQNSLAAGDLNGSTFPDLDGGGRTNGGHAGVGVAYNLLRTDLAVTDIANEWSYNSNLGVVTDWVATLPGQYLLATGTAAGYVKDIPAVVVPTIYDREEGGQDVIPSPAPVFTFPYEVNVVHWGADQMLFDSAVSFEIDPTIFGVDAATGWASMSVANTAPQAVIDFTGGAPVPVSEDFPPVIANTFWQRSLGNATENFGRVVEHNYTRPE